jgi:hypothetical protein
LNETISDCAIATLRKVIMKRLPVIMIGLAFTVASCAPSAATTQPTETPAVPTQAQEPTATTEAPEPTATTELQDTANTSSSQALSEETITASPAGARNFQPQLGQISVDLNEVVTLLPPDAIPAVLPERAQDIMVSAAQADDAGIDQSVQVIGLEIDGESRAYPIPFLSAHEIVNDEVGGRKIAVTW